jgi:hypothetical protein
MLAATTGELRLVIPVWGSILLALVGVGYLVFGDWLRRFFDVLSMTVLGCMVGLLAHPWVPVWQPVSVIVGGLVFGGLTALARNVCHAILAAIVTAAVLASLAALAVGQHGFTSYLAVNLSNRSYSVQLSGPNLACDPVLAAGLTGFLIGATVAIARFRASERLVTCAQGAALLVFSLASIISALRGETQPPLATSYPLTLSALWLCLVVIGLVAQAELARRQAKWAAEDQALGGREP